MSEDKSPEQQLAAATAVFEKDVGVWDAELTIHPSPGAPPIVQQGVAENRRVAGGRWLVTDFRAGGGFEGHGVYGFDPEKGRYIGTWVDSAMSTFARSEGHWDASTRTMTFETQAMHQGVLRRYREVTQTLEDGVQLYRHLTAMPDGTQFEMIRILYRRRSAG